jgi:hypothetical protein
LSGCYFVRLSGCYFSGERYTYIVFLGRVPRFSFRCAFPCAGLRKLLGCSVVQLFGRGAVACCSGGIRILFSLGGSPGCGFAKFFRVRGLSGLSFTGEFIL